MEPMFFCERRNYIVFSKDITSTEPWFEADTGRLEYLNRARFWRYITGDNDFDADYWLTRVENEYV